MVNTSASELRAGKKTRRLEATIEVGLDEGIEEVARELAGGESGRQFRSEAARVLLAEAILARRVRRARGK